MEERQMLIKYMSESADWQEKCKLKKKGVVPSVLWLKEVLQLYITCFVVKG